MLLAVDEFQAIYCKTQYRDPNFAGISSYHLSVPRMLMEFASAKRTFVRLRPFPSLFSPTPPTKLAQISRKGAPS